MVGGSTTKKPMGFADFPSIPIESIEALGLGNGAVALAQLGT